MGQTRLVRRKPWNSCAVCSRLHAELVKDDPLFPGNDEADHDLTVNVTGNPLHGSGCSEIDLTSSQVTGSVDNHHPRPAHQQLPSG